ncbi:MAG TPA: hypothetical protein VGX48_21095 [Pyrinomonadaceae bacterium]|jgi:hypothetical protein|nr:hypothetical protein [Pyrinomonadaceae bacterium]
MRKAQLLCALALALVSSGVPASAQRRRAAPAPAPLCPDPTVRCRTTNKFEPHQLPFRVPADWVIGETEQFYAVILRSVTDPTKGADCNVFIPEAERLEAQALFPRHKVFATRCYDPGEIYYTGTSEGRQFMAVYAGRTRAEAAAMLAKVRATGKYPGANLRRMRAGFNGT